MESIENNLRFYMTLAFSLDLLFTQPAVLWSPMTLCGTHRRWIHLKIYTGAQWGSSHHLVDHLGHTKIQSEVEESWGKETMCPGGWQAGQGDVSLSPAETGRPSS